MTSGFVHDEERLTRLGMPEAIFCEGKDVIALKAIVTELAAKPNAPVLFTRLPPDRYDHLQTLGCPALDYDPQGWTGTLNGNLPARAGSVAVVTAGTSDLRVALEAVRTLEFSGLATELIADVGVAGIHRLLARIDHIRSLDIVIVVAGWDAALASVMGGLTGQPVIAVPSSTGYGVAAGGTSALHSMLTSCGQGVLVTNIDNGFGAACGAIRMLNMMAGKTA
ncbi:AIR carboxylase family protein [Blastomonas sp. RAC04]|uniref:nickel pincer cofactor biosynthesis protein LarB n=1 Tax=Blastomonas sp. RAC04 TaxID=1842535 RepID=UPI00083E26BD|nr:nickel pincer cofactor biosynthesis protein LarB [Blastomonas sp. RAC04]AOG02490.1 AIR carboxylase family protein [Blastomonas sp. RAC04]